MGEHVTIEHGHHVAIDAHGWVAQRVGDDLTELTASLHAWGRLQHLTYTSLDWITRAELWCRARGYDIAESGPMTHDHYRLSAPVTILLAVADDHGTIAIVSVDDAPPTVYRDITTDDGYWYQVDSLDIACGCGRRWNWTGNELIDADGTATTVAAVFGDSPHTPFTPCPDCAAHDDHPTDPPCPTPGADPILCPHCGQRCDLDLAAVATYPQQRPHAVQVTETVDYTGWVLAVDPDDADDQAHRLLAEGNQNPGIGHLDVTHRNVEVMANDARDTCWRCRTDPNIPHPTCPHPAPHSSTAGRAANAGTPALSFDPLAATRWLRAAHREHPGTTNADVLGVDDEHFCCRADGFLNTIDDLLAANPAGLVRRADVQEVQMWRLHDGDVPDQGAVITVDLANGVRLATAYQDIKYLADRDLRGIAAAVSALAQIAGQISDVVRTYQRITPVYQP
jgi:hypothetical protein